MKPWFSSLANQRLYLTLWFAETWLNSVVNQGRCPTAWVHRRQLQQVWPIRACVLIHWFPETCFSCLANQSLFYYLDSQKPTWTAWPIRTVSYYLDFQKIGSTVWPIRACVLLPEFPEDRFFNCLTNQSLCLTTWISRNLRLLPGNQSLCLLCGFSEDWFKSACVLILDFQKNWLLLPGQSEPVSF